MCFFSGYVMAAGVDPAYIYGNPPTAGNGTLKIVNNENSLDTIAVLTKAGANATLFAIYIPSKTVGTINKMENGRYNVYFTSGIDWNEGSKKFNDGKFFELKSPLLIGEDKESEVELYKNPGVLGERIKHISQSLFPRI